MTPVKKRQTPKKRAAAKKRTATRKRSPANKRSATDPLGRVREICLALPEAHEVEAWGAPTFRVNNKIFAMYSANSHHSGGRVGLWLMSVSVEQDFVLRARPDRYFKPPYVGPSGWIGAWLDRDPPWAEIAELIRDAYRRRAPKKLAALVD
jgi:hypothetical protein